MKRKMIIATITFGAMLLFNLACSNSNANQPAEDVTVNTEEVAKQQVTPAVNEAIFQKGKLIEVAFLSIKEGKEDQLQKEYFPKVMPIVNEYGGKPLMQIGVKNAWSEDIKPQMVVFFEWPSAEKKEAFEKDERFIEVKKIRDDALSFLKLGFFEVEKDMPVQLDVSKFYEVYGMSLNEKNGHLMQKYFELAGPICTNEYGVDFALTMTPVEVNTSSSNEHFVPQTFGIAIWPGEEANSKYFNSKEYANIKHFKEDALERMDAWQGAVILN